MDGVEDKFLNSIKVNQITSVEMGKKNAVSSEHLKSRGGTYYTLIQFSLVAVITVVGTGSHPFSGYTTFFPFHSSLFQSITHRIFVYHYVQSVLYAWVGSITLCIPLCFGLFDRHLFRPCST